MAFLYLSEFLYGSFGLGFTRTLTMASGLGTKDSYLYNWVGMGEMRIREDWAQYVLDLPMAHAPGKHFEYSNGGSYLLSAIIQKATKMSAFEFAEKHLFGPLGIADVKWPSNRQGVNFGWGGMRLSNGIHIRQV